MGAVIIGNPCTSFPDYVIITEDRSWFVCYLGLRPPACYELMSVRLYMCEEYTHVKGCTRIHSARV